MLREKCRNYLSHQIRGKEASVGVMLVLEKEKLYPLPGPSGPASVPQVGWIVSALSASIRTTTPFPQPIAGEKCP